MELTRHWYDALVAHEAESCSNGYHIDSNKEMVIYPGSFNPLHDGHRWIYNYLQSRELDVFYEISIERIDKPRLSYEEIQQRLSQFHDERIIVTNAPTLLEKLKRTRAGFFSNSKISFAIGIDTYERLTYDEIKKLTKTCTLYIFPRDGYESAWMILKYWDLYHFDNIEPIDSVPTELRSISSTKIRNAMTAAEARKITDTFQMKEAEQLATKTAEQLETIKPQIQAAAEKGHEFVTVRVPKKLQIATTASLQRLGFTVIVRSDEITQVKLEIQW